MGNIVRNTVEAGYASLYDIDNKLDGQSLFVRKYVRIKIVYF